MKYIRRHLSFELLNHLYIERHFSSREIANQLDIPVCTIQYNLRRLGVKLRSLSEACKLKVEKSRNDPNFCPHRYLSGAGHWNWSGGRYLHKDGYIYVYAPDHPRVLHKKYNVVREHILVWESANGRLLPMDWVIHHINGIKADNRQENLLAMPRRGHHADLLLQTLKQRMCEVEDENAALKKQITLELKRARTP